MFYPVHYDDYYKVFLPAYYDECVSLCRSATTLHLWNNLVVKMGLFKKIGPPVGSYLHRVFEKTGINERFSEFYPEAVMKVMIYNAVIKIGEGAGIKRVLSLVVPSPAELDCTALAPVWGGNTWKKLPVRFALPVILRFSTLEIKVLEGLPGGKHLLQ